jgi:hypothetical protein
MSDANDVRNSVSDSSFIHIRCRRRPSVRSVGSNRAPFSISPGHQLRSMADHDLVARPVPAAFVKWTEVQKVLEESNTSGIISTSYAAALAHPDCFPFPLTLPPPRRRSRTHLCPPPLVRLFTNVVIKCALNPAWPKYCSYFTNLSSCNEFLWSLLSFCPIDPWSAQSDDARWFAALDGGRRLVSRKGYWRVGLLYLGNV